MGMLEAAQNSERPKLGIKYKRGKEILKKNSNFSHVLRNKITWQ
jgi:hypothetical protein